MPEHAPLRQDRDRNSPEAIRARQHITVMVLAGVLIAGGLLLLFVLERVPMPIRILAGLGDLFAGLVLLVVARQKFGRPGQDQPPTRNQKP